MAPRAEANFPLCVGEAINSWGRVLIAAGNGSIELSHGERDIPWIGELRRPSSQTPKLATNTAEVSMVEGKQVNSNGPGVSSQAYPQLRRVQQSISSPVPHLD